MASLEELAIPLTEATVVIQGFGCLAASAAYFLNQAGIKIIGLADAEKSLISRDGAGLDISTLIKGCAEGLIPDDTSLGKYGAREEIYNLPCDVFVPAAIEKAIDIKEAQSIEVRAIACGANLAVTAGAEKILQERGIIVIPDLVAGCGGSLSMEGLFGPAEMPTVEDVVAHVDSKTRKIVKKILKRSKVDGVSPREAALRICKETPLFPGTRPYGEL
jgi:glutamate dehydrogenase/leucine dehydrogenase